MRIALISDLHANDVALGAVFDDIDAAGVDETICLGDVATLGPRPHEVLGRLRDRGCRCIMGNHDEFLLEPTLIETYSEAPVVVEAVDWCREALSDEELDFVRGFERSATITDASGDTLFVFHGSPRSHMEDLLATTPPEEVDAMLEGHRANVMAGGHTHLQMLRQHRGTLLVNPGSVGLPFREYASGGPPTILDHAEYAIVELGGGNAAVSLRRVGLKRSALRAQLDGYDIPLGQMLRAEYAD